MRFLSFLIALITVQGCSLLNVMDFEPPKIDQRLKSRNLAELRFYRPESIISPNTFAKVEVANETIFRLAQKNFRFVKVRPGYYKLIAKRANDDAHPGCIEHIQLRAGEIQYISVNPTVEGIDIPLVRNYTNEKTCKFELEMVGFTRGKKEITKLY